MSDAMSDQIDPGLKRLFVATAEEPSDEVFVAAVGARTSRLRRLAAIGWGLSLVVAVAVLAVIAPTFAAAISRPAGALGQIPAALSATPFGSIATLALFAAGALCVRALAGLRAG
jgi:hypothetical protein